MTDTLELEIGLWRPGDLVSARYRLVAEIPRPDGVLAFDALDELDARLVRVVFTDPATDEVVVHVPRDRDVPAQALSWPAEALPRRSSFERVRRDLSGRADRLVRFVRARPHVLAVVALVVVGSGVLLWPRYERVPRLEGLSRAAALQALDAAGLTEGTVTERFEDTVRAGAIVSSSPVAGTRARRGSRVLLVVSKGPATVDVPDVDGMDVVEARAALADAGLAVRGTKELTNRAAKGTVLDHTPEGERVPRGTAVDLVVSKGPRPTAPPVRATAKPKPTASATAKATTAPRATPKPSTPRPSARTTPRPSARASASPAR